MATRFYALNLTAPYTPPSWLGGWDLDGLVTRAIDSTKFGGDVASSSRTDSVGPPPLPYRMGVLRGVSRRLAPQTISGTVNMVMAVEESAAGAEFFTRLHIYVINSTAGTLLGTLLNQYEETSGGGATEWPTTSTGRDLQSAQTLTSVVVPSDGNDYRLVIEMGVLAENSTSTPFTASIRGGATTGQGAFAEFPDLTVGSTSTLNTAGYFEFSGTVSYAADVIPNVSPATATILTFPSTIVQSLHDGGYTYTVWYRYTGVIPPDVVQGAFGIGNLSSFLVTTTVFLPTGALPDNFGDVLAQDKAVQFGILNGQTAYLRFEPNTTTVTPAALTLDVLSAPDPVLPSTYIAVNSTSQGGEGALQSFILAFVNPTTGELTKFIHPFASGEGADLLQPSGNLLAINRLTEQLWLYDRAYTQLSTIGPLATSFAFPIRANQEDQIFYVATPIDGTNSEIRGYNGGGALTTAITLVAMNVIGLAVNAGVTRIYLTEDLAPGLPIRRYDGSGTALADLVGGVVDIQAGRDMLMLPDGSVLATFLSDLTGALEVRRYSDGGPGTLVMTYPIVTTSQLPPVGPHLAYAPDHPDSFWVMVHTDSADAAGAGHVRFVHVRVSDGAILANLVSTNYEFGTYLPDATLTPDARFGPSETCAFWVASSEGPCPGDTTLARSDGLPYTPRRAPACGGAGMIGGG